MLAESDNEIGRMEIVFMGLWGKVHLDRKQGNARFSCLKKMGTSNVLSVLMVWHRKSEWFKILGTLCIES